MTLGKSWGPKVLAEGPESAKIMIVGEAPGATEKRVGKPFQGPAGNILRSALMHHGISPSEVYLTNLCKYQPPGNELSVWFQNGMPKPHTPALEGLGELIDEIDQVKPNLIIALGNWPLHFLGGVTKLGKEGPTGIGDWRGSIIEGAGIAGGRKVMASYHPAALLRQSKFRPFFQLDMGRVRKESLSPDIVRRPRRTIINPSPIERAELMDRYLNSPESLAFDIEYTPSSGNLICCAFSVDPEEAFTVAAVNGSDISFIQDMLMSGKDLVAQNGIFDCSILEYWYKIECLQYLKHDTMLAQHSAYIELPKDLGTLCSVYTDQPCYWTALGDNHWKQTQTDDWRHNTMVYNAIDAYVTKEVQLAQCADELQDPKIRKTFEFEMSLHKPLWNMSKRGVRVDLKLMSEYRKELDERAAASTARMVEVCGREINVKSGPAIAKLLFNDWGIKPTAFTDKKKPKTDDKTLVDVARRVSGEQLEVVNCIREIRECRDLKSKFLDIELDSDGRLRSHYAIGGTTTGRLASKKFYPTGKGGNLQNIPKDKRIRQVFVPDKDKLFFYNDYKSAESHVVAQLTGDTLMLELHLPGAKAHETTASYLFNRPVEEISKDSIERELGKMTRHACNYMMGWKRFMDNVNAKSMETGIMINAATSKMLVNGYQRMHPRLPEWWQRVNEELRRTGRLENLFGRPRQFFDRPDSCLPNAIAYIPQSTVGDLLNRALRKVEDDEECRDYGVEGLLQVHDAIGGQVKINYVEPAMRRIRELMSIPFYSETTKSTFVIPVDIAVGESWAGVKTLELAA